MLKTITFSILHFSVAFVITYALTGSVGISSTIALIEPLANTIVFHFHEKAWRSYEQRKTLDSNERKTPLHSCPGC